MAGFEPTTSASAGQRSNPLSYKRTLKLSAISPDTIGAVEVVAACGQLADG